MEDGCGKPVFAELRYELTDLGVTSTFPTYVFKAFGKLSFALPLISHCFLWSLRELCKPTGSDWFSSLSSFSRAGLTRSRQLNGQQDRSLSPTLQTPISPVALPLCQIVSWTHTPSVNLSCRPGTLLRFCPELTRQTPTSLVVLGLCLDFVLNSHCKH